MKNLAEGNISQKFRLKNIDETRNYLIKEINQNELMSKKHKNISKNLIYTEHFLILGLQLLDVFPCLLLLHWLVFL